MDGIVDLHKPCVSASRKECSVNSRVVLLLCHEGKVELFNAQRHDDVDDDDGGCSVLEQSSPGPGCRLLDSAPIYVCWQDPSHAGIGPFLANSTVSEFEHSSSAAAPGIQLYSQLA